MCAFRIFLFKYIQGDLSGGLEEIFVSYGNVTWRVHSLLYVQILVIQAMLKVYLHLPIYTGADTKLHVVQISAASEAGRTGAISFMSNFQAMGSTDMRHLNDRGAF